MPASLLLTIAHIFIICISNILVLYPLSILGFTTTYGAFSYPLIFIFTDLTTRLSGAKKARQIVFSTLIPGLILSFSISLFIQNSSSTQSATLPLRIALAGIIAYLFGQLMDILCFQSFKASKSWWIAPSIATCVGNIVDTFCFFFVAFYHCSHPFLAQHWQEIALIDLVIKICISQITFIPLYGVVLTLLLKNSSKISGGINVTSPSADTPSQPLN